MGISGDMKKNIFGLSQVQRKVIPIVRRMESLSYKDDRSRNLFNQGKWKLSGNTLGEVSKEEKGSSLS